MFVLRFSSFEVVYFVTYLSTLRLHQLMLHIYVVITIDEIFNQSFSENFYKNLTQAKFGVMTVACRSCRRTR